MEKTQKLKNNQITFYSILSSLIYAICLIVINKLDLPKIAGIMISFIPAITFVFFIKSFMRNINLMDEVERRIQLEAAVWAFSLGLLLLMTLGLLDSVVNLKKEYWGNVSFIIPCFYFFYALGIIISRRKYN
jgi:UDP-N-acetylmuramyl pentapeptide phosphotransferase/UDP-N-acetylglucosamine-1-phosphate transferase